MEFAGVLEVLAVGNGETVGSVKGWAGADIDVSVLVGIEDSFEAGLRRDIDRSWRKAYMLVCIIR